MRSINSFDIREFHDALIGSAPMPLDILEHRMRRCSEQGSSTDPNP